MRTLKSWLRPIAAGFVAIAVLAGSEARAAEPIDYSVDQSIGSGSVVGDIQTNGTLGVLAQSDIIGWNLTLNGAGATFNLTSAGGSAVLLVGNDLTATPTQLLFNYSGANGGYLAFQATNPGLFSGFHYYCNNTNWFGCSGGASVVPGGSTDPTAIYDTSWTGQQVIGTAGPTISDDELLGSILELTHARTAQMLVNQLESQVLLGLDEQISCGSCGGAGATFGSAALGAHGRYALSKDVTLFGGADLGEYRQKGADVSLNVGLAGAVQYDPVEMGHSRPYAEAGVSVAYQKINYHRAYTSSLGPTDAVGKTHAYDVSAFVQVGWVARVTPRDEAAAYVSYSRLWQVVGGYSEQAADGDPFVATMPGGTDVADVAGVNAQFTHLFGRRVEVDVNGGAEWAFHNKSGLVADMGGVGVSTQQPGFVYYEVGGRIGYRVRKRLTVDAFVNGILAPRAIGSSAHGGFDVRWSF